jgi:periplasmic protein CpxP/Spy
MKQTHFLKPMIMSATFVATAFATLLLVSTASEARPSMPEHAGHFSGHHLERMARAVDATPEQKTKLAEIAKTAQTDTQALQTQLKAGRERGLALMSAKDIDRNAVEQHRVDQFKLKEQMSRRHTQAMLDSADVLTPEQRLKLAEKMKSKGFSGRHSHSDRRGA